MLPALRKYPAETERVAIDLERPAVPGSMGLREDDGWKAVYDHMAVGQRDGTM